MSENTAEAQAWTPPPVGCVCWIEIPAVDVLACKKFYASLFPSWTFRSNRKDHTDEEMASWQFAGNSALSGGIHQVPAASKTTVQQKGVGATIFYFVESIDETQKRVEELGGTSCSGKEAQSDSGWYMYFRDVEGNMFGAYEMKK